MKTLLVLCIMLYTALGDQERDMNSVMTERQCPPSVPVCNLLKIHQARNMNSAMTERDYCPYGGNPSCHQKKAQQARNMNSAITERGVGQANFAEKEESKYRHLGAIKRCFSH